MQATTRLPNFANRFSSTDQQYNGRVVEALIIGSVRFTTPQPNMGISS